MPPPFTIRRIYETLTLPPEGVDVDDSCVETDASLPPAPASLRDALDALESQCWDDIDDRGDGTLILYPADGSLNYRTGEEIRETVIIKGSERNVRRLVRCYAGQRSSDPVRRAEEIVRAEARTIAGEWHGGQASALYAYASSGYVSLGIAEEIGDVWAIAREEGEADCAALRVLERTVRRELPRYAWPGGYEILYQCADGGILCQPCATSPGNPVGFTCETPTDWRIVANTHTGEMDDPETCDHCGMVVSPG